MENAKIEKLKWDTLVDFQFSNNVDMYYNWTRLITHLLKVTLDG